jgi:glycosyltransferase involved in cell wall biosynthesis
LATEVIVIDDGSTDGSWEELARLKRERYPDLRILSHPDRANLGVSASRYRGFLAASGTYVAFLDADDVFLPGKLEAQLRARAYALKSIRFAITQLFQYEDWLCWCLLAAWGPFLFLDQPLVGYRVHEHAVARSRLRHLYALLELKIALFARC